MTREDDIKELDDILERIPVWERLPPRPITCRELACILPYDEVVAWAYRSYDHEGEARDVTWFILETTALFHAVEFDDSKSEWERTDALRLDDIDADTSYSAEAFNRLAPTPRDENERTVYIAAVRDAGVDHVYLSSIYRDDELDTSEVEDDELTKYVQAGEDTGGDYVDGFYVEYEVVDELLEKRADLALAAQKATGAIGAWVQEDEEPPEHVRRSLRSVWTNGARLGNDTELDRDVPLVENTERYYGYINEKRKVDTVYDLPDADSVLREAERRDSLLPPNMCILGVAPDNEAVDEAYQTVGERGVVLKMCGTKTGVSCEVLDNLAPFPNVNKEVTESSDYGEDEVAFRTVELTQEIGRKDIIAQVEVALPAPTSECTWQAPTSSHARNKNVDSGVDPSTLAVDVPHYGTETYALITYEGALPEVVRDIRDLYGDATAEKFADEFCATQA